jgi:hypothetical protein
MCLHYHHESKTFNVMIYLSEKYHMTCYESSTYLLPISHRISVVCRFVVHHTPRDLSVKEAITNFVNESDCDFFAIAPRAKNAMSSVSDYVINHVACNIILCKN